MQYAAILRGINVGGKRKILMADLKQLLQKYGFQNIQTYIQSGNVIFDWKGNESNEQLAAKIKERLQEKYDFEVPVLVRSANQIKEAIATNPYVKSKKPIENLHLTFLQSLPEEDKLTEISIYDYPPDTYQIIDLNVFVCCANGYSASKYTNQFFEKKLKVAATTRNWKTVLKLAELMNVK